MSRQPAGPIIAALGVPWALLATFGVAPSFEAMFRDFGGPLPHLTALMLRPWGPLSLAFFSLGAVLIVWRSAPGGALALAIGSLVIQPALFLVAMYLPIFAIAGAVK